MWTCCKTCLAAFDWAKDTDRPSLDLLQTLPEVLDCPWCGGGLVVVEPFRQIAWVRSYLLPANGDGTREVVILEAKHGAPLGKFRRPDTSEEVCTLLLKGRPFTETAQP